jgi:CBS domain-containing protein
VATVRELMATDPFTVEPEETLRSAADLLTDGGVSGAPVVSGDKVVGVVTLIDILDFDAHDVSTPTHRPDLVNPITEGPVDDPESAEEQDPPSRFFVEMWEDAGADTLTRFETAGPEWNPLDEHTVSEVMSPVVFSVSPDASLKDAAALMEKRKVHRLLVMEGEQLVGILTAWDIVRAVAHDQVGGGRTGKAA